MSESKKDDGLAAGKSNEAAISDHKAELQRQKTLGGAKEEGAPLEAKDESVRARTADAKGVPFLLAY